MDCSTSENESFSEVETLKQQLATYKLINSDLSKKIQELKVELNNFRQENANIKTALLDERAKSVRYRNHFSSINRHCMNFFNTYTNQMNQINEIDNTLLEELHTTENNNRHDQDSHSSTIVPNITQIQRPEQQNHAQRYSTIRSQLSSVRTEEDDSGNNILNTIAEESSLPFTSTPIVPRAENIQLPSPYSPQNYSDITQHEEDDNVEQSPGLPATHAETCASPDTSHALNQVTPSKQDDNIVDTPRFSAVPAVSRRISIGVNDNNNESSKENDLNNEQSTVNHTQNTIVHKDPSIKESRVALSPLKTGNSSNILKRAQSSSYDDDESIEDKSNAASTSKSSRLQSEKPNNSYANRPRRKARPTAESMAEPSLKTKLRRSSKKK